MGGSAASPSRVPSASETTKGRGAPVADASRAGARDDSGNLEDARGDPRRVRARARARVFPDASASATPSTQTNATGASRFDKADPHGVVETPPPVVISLPVVLAPVPDLDRDDDTGVAARARLREAHVPGDFNVADRRGPPARGSPAETAKSDERRAYFFRERDERSYSNCHSNEHCADAVYGQPTIGHGSPLPYPKVVRGVHAPRCLRDRPPTCTCFGPFTFARPWGYYCVLVPSKDDPKSPPPPIDAPSPPPLCLRSARRSAATRRLASRATSRRKASTPAACVCSWTAF